MSDAQFFRDGLAQGRLLVRRCAACARAAYPPMPGCPHCGHEAGEVVEAEGTGRLYSWTVCHVAFDPAFAADVPYVVGLVDLPEGARVVARVELGGADPRPDMSLVAAFPPGDDGTPELRFVGAPAESEDS